MTARRLILWRHGQTSWNSTGRFQGQADIPLYATGEQQARSAAPVLAGYRPTRIIASDLVRAQQTAGELAGLTGLEVETDARFREIHVGEWEGLTIADVMRLDPDFIAREVAGGDSRRGETGESTGEVARRIADALSDVVDHAPDGEVIVVTMHGLAIRVGAAAFLGLDLQQARLFGGLDNCGWVVLDHHPSGMWRVMGYNLVADPHAVGDAQTKELAHTAPEDPTGAPDDGQSA